MKIYIHFFSRKYCTDKITAFLFIMQETQNNKNDEQKAVRLKWSGKMLALKFGPTLQKLSLFLSHSSFTGDSNFSVQSSFTGDSNL